MKTQEAAGLVCSKFLSIAGLLWSCHAQMSPTWSALILCMLASAKLTLTWSISNRKFAYCMQHFSTFTLFPSDKGLITTWNRTFWPSPTAALEYRSWSVPLPQVFTAFNKLMYQPEHLTCKGFPLAIWIQQKITICVHNTIFQSFGDKVLGPWFVISPRQAYNWSHSVRTVVETHIVPKAFMSRRSFLYN